MTEGGGIEGCATVNNRIKERGQKRRERDRGREGGRRIAGLWEFVVELS